MNTNLLQCLEFIAKEQGITISDEVFRTIPEDDNIDHFLSNAANYIGFECESLTIKKIDIDNISLPAISLYQNQPVIVYELDESVAYISSPTESDNKKCIPTDDFLSQSGGRIWLVQKTHQYRKTNKNKYLESGKSWLFEFIKDDTRFYLTIALAALLSNTLALTTALFSMQVYDRVIPSQSFNTLWVLFAGVLFALFIEMVLKITRSHLADSIGKKIDMQMSSMFYSKSLKLKNSARPASSGIFISQLREMEQVRELLTSTTVVAMVDIPFIVIFICVIYSIGNYLAIPALIAVPLIIIPGLLIQKPSSKLSKAGLRESVIKNSLLVETIEGLDDIKLTQSENKFLNTWNQCTQVSSEIALRQRHLSCLLTSWCQFIQQFVFVGVVAIGVYFVVSNDITTGTLIACSILSSRTVAPLASIASIFTRWQNAKLAKEGLDRLITAPSENDSFDNKYHLEAIKGDIELRDVKFRFNQAEQYSVDIPALQIESGEKVAIIGSIGAGKTTLLKLISGLADHFEGTILIDNVPIEDINMHDLRNHIGYLSQEARLFHGSLRDNLLMGQKNVDPEFLKQCLKFSGAEGILERKRGLDLIISEGGEGLSGGQKQAILLARTLLRNPQLLLLDEPTSSMDNFTENRVISALSSYSKNKTMLLVTHRMSLLKLVDRVIVMHKGKIVLDGDRDIVLAKLQGKTKKAS